ncbi:nucleusenvelope protein [Citrus sinensis]|nr:nucleusenvelope protein [Citrus sinensis]
MNCIQATSAGKPCVHLPNRIRSVRERNTARRTSLKLNATAYNHGLPALKCRQKNTVVCSLGGKDKSDDKGAPWQDFSKAMGNLGKGQSVEDVLRQQIQKQEFYDGDGGKSPPRRGGGGHGGGGSEESGDEGVSGIIDETVQVVLATIGFILLPMFIIISHLLISLQYIYIIAGEELTKLGKDYIKYLLGGSKSVRLSNAMDALESFWKTLSDNKLVYDKYWLEKEILNTTTWFDGPEKYRRMLRSYMERSADEES